VLHAVRVPLQTADFGPARMQALGGPTAVLQWCYSGVTVVLQWCYSDVTKTLQWPHSIFTVALLCVSVAKVKGARESEMRGGGKVKGEKEDTVKEARTVVRRENSLFGDTRVKKGMVHIPRRGKISELIKVSRSVEKYAPKDANTHARRGWRQNSLKPRQNTHAST
jgi:hypothetical protein